MGWGNGCYDSLRDAIRDSHALHIHVVTPVSTLKLARQGSVMDLRTGVEVLMVASDVGTFESHLPLHLFNNLQPNQIFRLPS